MLICMKCPEHTMVLIKFSEHVSAVYHTYVRMRGSPVLVTSEGNSSMEKGSVCFPRPAVVVGWNSSFWSLSGPS